MSPASPRREPRPAVSGALETGRRELKYLMPSRGGRSDVLRVQSLVPALGVQHQPRQVTSAYFDSAAYRAFRLSSAGSSHRLKMRLRWYGDPRRPSSPILELKFRLNHRGWKSRHVLDPMDLDRMTWAAIRAEVLRQVPDVDRLHVETLCVPVLIVTYRRHYLVTMDRRLRVTVDSDLRYFDQRTRARPNLVFDTVAAHFAVVECKMDAALDPGNVVGGLCLRWTRFSKYCHGVSVLSGL